MSACRRTAATTASPTATSRSRTTVADSGVTGQPLTCNRGSWNTAAGTAFFVKWYRSNKITQANSRWRAPSSTDYWNQTTPAEPAYGSDPLTWTDSQVIADSSAGGTVPATLSLTLGPPASFGAFTPGVERTCKATTSANGDLERRRRRADRVPIPGTS